MGLNDRKGKFTLSDNRSDFGQWYQDVQCVLERVVVVRCEHMAISRGFEYDAYSPHFEEVPIGCSIPEYEAIIEHNDDGHPVFKEFKKINLHPV